MVWLVCSDSIDSIDSIIDSIDSIDSIDPEANPYVIWLVVQ